MEWIDKYKIILIILFILPIYFLYDDTEIGQRLCRQLHNKADKSCMRKYFSDILLIIVFNSALYNNIPTLQDLYKDAFPNIVNCGPQSNKEYGVISADINKGIFAYECVNKALNSTKNYRGYLIINDDLILNFWNLARFDKKKLWEGPKIPISLDKFLPPKVWYWWDSRWGMKNCQMAFNEVFALRNDSEESKEIVDDLIKNLETNGKGVRNCYRGRSDIFYVPSRHIVQFQTLANVFKKQGVFLEIAVPTIFRLLDIEINFEKLLGIYLPGKKGEGPARDSTYFWTVYSEDLDFVHPLKLHYPLFKAMNIALLENWIKSIGKRWTDCFR